MNTSWKTRGARGVALIVALFLARVIAAMAIVPPWQGPDEPAHFVLGGIAAAPDAARPALRADLEHRVLQSMARHGWWTFYQRETPDPLPTAFGEIPEQMATGTLMQPVYYTLAASVLWLFPSVDLMNEYHQLRALSVILSLGALLCGYAGTRLMFGSVVAFGASTIAALHPQFLLSALTVGPDALINLCGAFIWWQLGRLLRLKGFAWLSCAALVLLAGVVAALSKRNGIPLVPIGLLAIAITMTPVQKSHLRPWTVLGGVAFGVVVIAGVLRVLQFSESGARLITFWTYALVIKRQLSDVDPYTLISFVKASVDTSWLVAGWLRFPAPEAWNVTAYVITVLGVAGALLFGRRATGDSRALWLSWLFVGLQIGSLLVVTFVAWSAPQGRYFLAAMAPMSALIWIGLTGWKSHVFRVPVGVTVVAAVALLDLTGFTMVLMSAYL